MISATQSNTKPSIKLDSLDKMIAFVRKNKFPYNLSEEEYIEAEQEYSLLQKTLNIEDALHDMRLKYSANIQNVLSDFAPINTADNDKRKRKKKISLRIIAEENQTKVVVISPGLFELLDEPTYVSFQVKDNVLAIARGLPSSTDYKLHVEHHGYVVKSESLVDYLCDYYKLLDYTGSMNANDSKQFKTAFSEYKSATLKLGRGLTKVVFMYIPSSR